jgi:hypothetical protein
VTGYLIFSAAVLGLAAISYFAPHSRRRNTAPTPCGCRLCTQTDYWFFGAFVAVAVNNPDLTAVGRAITADLFEMPEEES